MNIRDAVRYSLVGSLGVESQTRVRTRRTCSPMDASMLHDRKHVRQWAAASLSPTFHELRSTACRYTPDHAAAFRVSGDMNDVRAVDCTIIRAAARETETPFARCPARHRRNLAGRHARVWI